MVIDGSGFIIREKILKSIEDKKDIQETNKKNGKAKSLSSPSKSDVLEISTENLRASKVGLRSFEEALSLLNDTASLIKERGMSLGEVHSGIIDGSAVKIVIS